MKLRGARGLGDAVYMYPIAKYLARNDKRVQIMTKYPVVYDVLTRNNQNIICIDRFAGEFDINCRYGDRYPIQSTNMWQDALITAGLIDKIDEIPFEFEYRWSDPFKFPTSKKICLIKTPCFPHGKVDGSSVICLPDLKIWQRIINEFKDQCYFVMSGLPNGLEYKNYTGLDEDLSHIDIIPRLMSLVDQSDIVLAPSSHFASFAEGLNKKVLMGFSQKALDCDISFYRWSTPTKVITKHKTSDAFIDSEPIKKILDKFERLLNK